MTDFEFMLLVITSLLLLIAFLSWFVPVLVKWYDKRAERMFIRQAEREKFKKNPNYRIAEYCNTFFIEKEVLHRRWCLGWIEYTHWTKLYITPYHILKFQTLREAEERLAAITRGTIYHYPNKSNETNKLAKN